MVCKNNKRNQFGLHQPETVEVFGSIQRPKYTWLSSWKLKCSSTICGCLRLLMMSILASGLHIDMGRCLHDERWGFPRVIGVSLKSSAFAQRNQRDTGVIHDCKSNGWNIHEASRFGLAARIHGDVWNRTPCSTHKQILAIVPISILFLLFPSHAFKIFQIILIVCVVSRPLGSFFHRRYPSLQLCLSLFICSVRPCCLRLLQIHQMQSP